VEPPGGLPFITAVFINRMVSKGPPNDCFGFFNGYFAGHFRAKQHLLQFVGHHAHRQGIGGKSGVYSGISNFREAFSEIGVSLVDAIRWR
jgi:hypothetical protein